MLKIWLFKQSYDTQTRQILRTLIIWIRKVPLIKMESYVIFSNTFIKVQIDKLKENRTLEQNVGLCLRFLKTEFGINKIS